MTFRYVVSRPGPSNASTCAVVQPDSYQAACSKHRTHAPVCIQPVAQYCNALMYCTASCSILQCIDVRSKLQHVLWQWCQEPSMHKLSEPSMFNCCTLQQLHYHAEFGSTATAIITASTQQTFACKNMAYMGAVS